MKTAPKELYKEVLGEGKDEGSVVDAERHKHYIGVSTTVLATENEITAAKIEFGYLGKCKVHLFYDEGGFLYHERYCGICGALIGLI